MSQEIQIALQTLLKTLPELADEGAVEKVTRSDSAVLDKGVTHAAVIWPGQFTSGDASGYSITRTWSIPFDLVIRYTTEGETFRALTAFIDDTVALLDAHPTLNGMENITLDRLSSDGPVTALKDKAEQGPFFLYQSFLLEITERVALSGGEYV
jgi:hypothetical protein